MTLTADVRISGTVKCFNAERRFGFIWPDVDGPDTFVRAMDVVSIGDLGRGDRVEYEVEEHGGRVRAVRVHLVSKRAQR